MNAALRESMLALTTKFADDLLDLVWEQLSRQLASGDGALAPTSAGRPRVRRSEGDLRAAGERILAVLAKAPAGLRAEDLRRQVGMRREAMGRPLRMLLASGQIRKSGEKRATVYAAGRPATPEPAPAAAAARPDKKVARPKKPKAKPAPAKKPAESAG